VCAPETGPAPACVYTPPDAKHTNREASAEVMIERARDRQQHVPKGRRLGGRSFSSGITGISKGRCYRLEFSATASNQTTARVPNRRKSAIYSFPQKSFLLLLAAHRTGKTCSKVLISNRNIRRLETHLTSAKSTCAPFLIATNSHIADSVFVARRFDELARPARSCACVAGSLT
jgi:hypothetical protein